MNQHPALQFAAKEAGRFLNQLDDRPVTRACGDNRIAVLIPCHRVIGADGKIRGYRWGIDRKEALLDSERYAANDTGAEQEAGK